jgi:hypothetical protein
MCFTLPFEARGGALTRHITTLATGETKTLTFDTGRLF